MNRRACVLAFVLGSSTAAMADPTSILFVGNSYTHGRYNPVLNYNAGYGDNPGNDVVHDLSCRQRGGIAGRAGGRRPAASRLPHQRPVR